jgi:hypothetical protein
MVYFKRMRKPNFFIIGAPKCGTTSLASWLGQHPNIFMSNPKEPRFFSSDYRAPGRPRSIEEYEKLFAGASSTHKAVGEATTIYLRSKTAVPDILNYSPEARFIVCLRNPISMAPSVHAQLLKQGIETESSFERAWELQLSRTQGKNIPVTCSDKKVLWYGKECKLGSQMKRLYEIVPREQVLVIFLEDMKVDPRKEYRRVLTFLEVDDDGRTHFPVQNARAVPRYPRLAQAISIAGLMKIRLGLQKNWGIGSIIYRLNNRAPRKNRASREMQAALRDYFKEDIELLAKLMNRDLSHWIEI